MSRVFRRSWLAAACLFCALSLAVSPHPAEAQASRIGSLPASDALSPDQERALRARLDAFVKELDAGNMAALVGAMPPRIIALLTERANVSADVLRAQMRDAMASAMEDRVFEADLMLDGAIVRQDADAAPYVLVPTQTRITADRHVTATVDGVSIALMDAGKWYVFRLSDAANEALLKEAYPSLSAEKLPRPAEGDGIAD